MELNATLFGQMITFAIFVWFTVKFIWPMITKVMQARQEEIANGLTDAENGRRLLERSKIEHHNIIEEAKLTASHILQDANKRAMTIVEEAKEKAREEGQEIIKHAHAELDQTLQRARRDLQAQVAVLAVKGAEKILKEEIDAKKHERLLTQLISELNHG